MSQSKGPPKTRADSESTRRPKTKPASRPETPSLARSASTVSRSKALTTSESIGAIQVDRRGMGIGGRIHWESTVSTTEITSAQAEDAQTRAGYSPFGYGFFSFTCKKVDGGYQATWTCSTSCD